MTKFFACPYASDHWELGATLYNGTIYIVEHEDPNRNKFGDNEEQQRFTYYGYKFEQIATSDQEPNGSMERDQEPNGFMERDQGQVNTNVQFCSVFSTKLNQHRIVMGGEVDCLYRKRKEDKYSYCELKTNRVIVSDRQQRNLIKYKLLKTWIQSFLIGVKHVIFGYRDDQGLLQQIQVYETSELPRLARPEKLWDPFVCMSFADQILKMIKETVTIDDRETVYVIRYDARSRLVTIEGPHRQPDMVFVYEFEYTAEG
ncbi:RAI1 like PD-XK nuclease-domain-containing protein [Gorgonomyces haynaldii]|nr:RAI1 like PD-XK nuclease-domain-containing protein [Gorgonomyces haynaldii]